MDSKILPSHPTDDVDVDYLIPRMWGNVYYHEKAENNQRFKRQPEMSGDPRFASAGGGGASYIPEKSCRVYSRHFFRTFVQFVLTPIYKLYSACVGEPEKTVEVRARGTEFCWDISEV